MSRMWYYSDKKQQKGPIPFEELRGLAHSGYLKPSDLVWEEGAPDWIRASLVDGLFEAGQAGGGVDRDRGRDRDDRGYDDEPRGRRRDEGYDDRPRRRDEEPDDRPRRRDEGRREIARRPQGMSSGLKIGLIVGGIALVLIVVAVILIIVLSNSGGGGGGGGAPYTVTLRGGQSDARMHSFRAGQTVEIRVNSVIIAGFDADVDLAVFDPGNLMVANDARIDKNCFATFRVNRTGQYRVVVQNLGPGEARSTVTMTIR